VRGTSGPKLRCRSCWRPSIDWQVQLQAPVVCLEEAARKHQGNITPLQLPFLNHSMERVAPSLPYLTSQESPTTADRRGLHDGSGARPLEMTRQMRCCNAPFGFFGFQRTPGRLSWHLLNAIDQRFQLSMQLAASSSNRSSLGF
jgi:hypothetical protein